MPGFDVQAVNAALAGTLFHNKVHHFASVDSTNTLALNAGSSGADAGQVFLADEQTAGRGRGGHSWHSEPDRGLYLTMLVRPRLRTADVLKLSLIAGIAAANAIEEVTASPIIDLRWPNDLVIGSLPARKVGGILTEAVSSASGELRYAAIGIGINLNQAEFPNDIQSTATSLRRELGVPVHRELLAIALLRAMSQELEAVATTDESATTRLFQAFENCSTWVRGKRVRVAEDDGYTGTTAGLTPEGLLRIQCDDGRERVVRHGGVREL